MKANELRIGNLVKCSRGIIKIAGIGDRNIQDHEYTYRSYSDLQPIPLTPEILEKSGFVREQEGYNDFNIKATWALDAFTLIEYNDNTFLFDHEMNLEPLHVHSLQNLFFYLTQTELNVEI